MAECIVDVKFKVEFKNENGEKQTEFFTAEVEVPCDTYTEWCHGPHTMYDIDDSMVELAVEKFIDELTDDDVRDYLDEYEITEVLSVEEA